MRKRTPSVTRRGFIQATVGSLVAGSGGTRGQPAGAGPEEGRIQHFVPASKGLSPAWVDALFARGEPRVYGGDELDSIGMPVGGIAAGQLYLSGDGRLTHWDIFNRHARTGAAHYSQDYREPPSPVDQGFAIRVRTENGVIQRTLDRDGFPGVTLLAEYPIGTVEYNDPDLPLGITLQAFSPFIPLNAADSGLPATILRFTLHNRTAAPVEASIAGWLQNAVLLHSGPMRGGFRRNRIVRRPGLTFLECSAAPLAPEEIGPVRPPEVFADFEGPDYGGWKVEGEAFGEKPATGTLAGQQPVAGFQGKGLVNTFIDGDAPHGKLTSPEFIIERPFINFLVGGGSHAGQTCINLLVGGKPVRTATGRRQERLVWNAWGVRDLRGKRARIEIVDAQSSAWGHINIDQIELADEPRTGGGPIEDQGDFGTMGLGLIGPRQGVAASVAIPPSPQAPFAPDGSLPVARQPDEEGAARVGAADLIRGALGRTVTVRPGERATVTFLVTWHFPNHPEGRNYANQFTDAAAVGAYVSGNLERLVADTFLWHDTYYDSTLPHWLLDRIHMPVSTLATSTVQWRRNGRFWGWEGVGCCAGTCTHVWNYEHAMARLFPELERSVREMQDFGEGFDGESGLVGFRGNRAYAADGQCGTILKAYREHLMSTDESFLERNWLSIKKAMEYSINRDANDDGLIEDSQHNTYDINFVGANTFVGSLYLGALRAAEEMAKLMGDEKFAGRCRKAFEAGRRLTMERLFDGEYFTQDVDLAEHPKSQYGKGCLSDQLFGQGWAHQLGLGYIYPKDAVHSAIRAVFKYNWAPDVGAHNAVHRPGRSFATPGEAGLFTCTWPKSPHLPDGVRYKNEA
ncbi:MAG: GH116 family glycosyl hydrolase, partial [Armatimonadota bacterium]